MLEQSIGIHCYDFDDYKAGEGFRTGTRTITETDLVMFSTLTGDTNPLHMDEEYARDGTYGKKVCQGLLIVSYTAGLISKVGYIDGSTIALRQMEWHFRAPVFPGDTIYATVTIKGKRKLTDEVGLVNSEINVFNQRHEVCVSGTWKMMVSLHPDAGISGQSSP